MDRRDMQDVDEVRTLWGKDGEQLLESVRMAGEEVPPLGFSTRLRSDVLQSMKSREEPWRIGFSAVPLLLFFLSVAYLFRGGEPRQEPFGIIFAEDFLGVDSEILEDDLILLEEL